MKKLDFLLALLLPYCFYGQAIVIPDDEFKARLLLSSSSNGLAQDSNGDNIAIDANHNGEIEISEALSVYRLAVGMVMFTPITDVTGLEYFTNLTHFDCSNHAIASLDVSMLSNLNTLFCDGNQMQNLNVAGLNQLETLNCATNALSHLDVSGLANLKWLSVSSNSLTAFDVSDLASVEIINADHNQLTSLDLSNKSNLTFVDCAHNNLTSLELSGSVGLEGLRCFSNQLTQLILVGMNNLKNLECYLNDLESLDLTDNPMLEVLHCASNEIPQLEVGHCSNLHTLVCFGNELTTLDVNGLQQLTTLSCGANPLQTLYLKNIGYLEDGNGFLGFAEVPDLSYVCTDETRLPVVQQRIEEYGYTGCTADTACVLDAENFSASVFTVFPNPAGDVLNVQSKVNTLIRSLEIYNILGQLSLALPLAPDTDPIDVSSLATGVYIIKASSSKGIVQTRFIKN